mgnify:CR=1 FL=1
MEISRKTDYALRMLAALVQNPEGVVSVRTAAKDNDIPYSFARSIQHDLALAGIVESTRGAHGGMRLAVDPRTTSLLKLVEAVQGPVLIAACDYAGEDGVPCPRMAGCHAERVLRAYCGSVTLYQVVMEGKMPQMTGSFKLVGSKRKPKATDE